MNTKKDKCGNKVKMKLLGFNRRIGIDIQAEKMRTQL